MASEVQVIGAGLMRTGTNSLQLALERLLHGKCYHMFELQANPRHTDFWIKACTEPTSDEEWRQFFADYTAAVDFPEVAFYERLMEVYPKAKVVLTVRDPKKWFASVGGTIVVVRRKTFFTSLLMLMSEKRKFAKMGDLVYERVFGDDFDLENEERMIKAFEAHNRTVQERVPKDRLLVFDVKEGWGPLCDFLGVPVPDEPFPHVNSRRQFAKNDKSTDVGLRLGRSHLFVFVGLVIMAISIRLFLRW